MSGSSTSASCIPNATPDPGCSHGVSAGLGIPDAGNVPGGRSGAAGWIDSNGNLWLFGGYGSDLLGFVGFLNDLWEFNPSTNEWAWMAGSGTLDAVEVPGQMGMPDTWIVSYPPQDYGTSGAYAPGNGPMCREYANSWSSNGILWLFGGDATGLSTSDDDDLWGFNPLTMEWVWMGGSSDNSTPVPGIYGTLGVPASGNFPGTRYSATSWTDSSGNLWLFGGTSQGFYGNFNDLWEYTPPPPPLAAVPMPSFSPRPGQYLTAQVVAISDSMLDATVYYTTDGTWPTTKSAVYAGPLMVEATETLKAMAVETGYSDSGVTTAVFTIDPVLPAPTFSPPGGTYVGTQIVMIGETALDTTIYYTTDGTTPTTKSAVYSIPVAVSHLEQILAMATAVDSSASATASASYRIKLPMPVFSPPLGGPTSSGIYSPPLSVQISDTTPNTTIYFTTNGTAPTRDSAVYSGPISVGVNETLEAFATTTMSGLDDSDTATASYMPDALIPRFNPSAGFYLSPLTVNIFNSMPTSTIYYTADGTTPTTSSPVMAGLITLTKATTLNAFATTSGRSSAVASATYTFVQMITGISLPNTASVSIGSTMTLMATVAPANATNPTLDWVSSDPRIATVDSVSGAVTGVSAGTAQITAASTDGSGIISNACTVTVGPSFSIAPSASSGNTDTVNSGGTATYGLVLTPASGTTFPSSVSLSATGLPPGATATFTPATIAAGSGTTTVSLSIQTRTRALLRGDSARWTLAVCMLLLPLAGARRWHHGGGRLFRNGESILWLLLVLGVAGSLMACSGGSIRSTPISYNITVNASSGNEQESTTLNLTVE